jgi:NDP-sugar pyrophosphorylase family protein
MTLPVAILAGGLGTRLGPRTRAIPKSLIEVAGEPFIVQQLRLLRERGIERVVLCLGHLGSSVREELQRRGDLGLRVDYAFDGEGPLGTGGALKRAVGLLGEAFMVLYGDSYLDIDYAAVQAAFAACGKLGLMTVCRNEDRWDRSNVLFEGGRIVRYDKRRPGEDKEKGKGQGRRLRHIDFGLGVLKSAALEQAPADTPYDLAALYGSLVAEGQLAGYEVATRFYEIGSLEGIAQTDEYIRSRSVD